MGMTAVGRAAGSVVLAEDVAGRGHVTEHEPGVRRILQIPLDPA